LQSFLQPALQQLGQLTVCLVRGRGNCRELKRGGAMSREAAPIR
jgi:hypothetical protein